MKCKCYASYSGSVIFCPLHAAAKDMYEALEGIVADLENIVQPSILEATKEVLAEAKAK